LGQLGIKFFEDAMKNLVLPLVEWCSRQDLMCLYVISKEPMQKFNPSCKKLIPHKSFLGLIRGMSKARCVHLLPDFDQVAVGALHQTIHHFHQVQACAQGAVELV
jgi:hypothetical protein